MALVNGTETYCEHSYLYIVWYFTHNGKLSGLGIISGGTEYATCIESDIGTSCPTDFKATIGQRVLSRRSIIQPSPVLLPSNFHWNICILGNPAGKHNLWADNQFGIPRGDWKCESVLGREKTISGLKLWNVWNYESIKAARKVERSKSISYNKTQNFAFDHNAHSQIQRKLHFHKTVTQQNPETKHWRISL